MKYFLKLRHWAIVSLLMLTLSSCGSFGQDMLDTLKSGFSNDGSSSNSASSSYNFDGNQWVQIVSNNKPTVYIASVKMVDNIGYFWFPVAMPYEYRSYLSQEDPKFKEYLSDYKAVRPLEHLEGHDTGAIKSFDKKTGQLSVRALSVPGNKLINEEFLSCAKSCINRSFIDSRRLSLTENASTANYLVNVEVAWSYFDYKSSSTTIKNAKGHNETTHYFNVYSCYHFILHFVSAKTQKEVMKATFSCVYKGRESAMFYDRYFNTDPKFVYAFKDKAVILPLVHQVFPVSSVICSINETDKKGNINKVIINVGSSIGVTNKMRFGLFSEVDIAGESILKEIGELEVEQVFDNTALCKVKKGKDKIKDDVIVFSKSLREYRLKPSDFDI